jgi:hypothetical protein
VAVLCKAPFILAGRSVPISARWRFDAARRAPANQKGGEANNRRSIAPVLWIIPFFRPY